MSDRIKFEMEFPIKVSQKLLFQYISTPSGLSEWFADNVNSRGEIFIFIWDDSEESAKLIRKINNEKIQFKWLDDSEIGLLDERWNWLEGWTSNHNDLKPFAVHYTRGGPWFNEWQDVEFAKEWLHERDKYIKNKFKDLI